MLMGTPMPSEIGAADSELTIRLADLTDPGDQQAVVELTDHYAQQETGQGRPLDDQVRQRLIPALREHGGAVVLLGWYHGRAVAIATCVLGFSTFRARPLLGIHDLAVHASVRRRGFGEAMLRAVIDHADRLGCCGVTLEVRGDNPAKRLYERVGFSFTEGPHGAPMYFGKLVL